MNRPPGADSGDGMANWDRTSIAAAWCVVGISAGAASQPETPLVRVQQGVGDRGPLGRDLQVPFQDLRLPSGFDGVYRGQTAGGAGFHARIHGGITAVFPWSVYTQVAPGVEVAEVPAGTVFYIGGLPEHGMGRRPPIATLERVDLSAGSLRSARPATPGLRAGPAPWSLDNTAPGTGLPEFDPAHEKRVELRRVGRVAELLRQAAAAELRRR